MNQETNNPNNVNANMDQNGSNIVPPRQDTQIDSSLNYNSVQNIDNNTFSKETMIGSVNEPNNNLNQEINNNSGVIAPETINQVNYNELGHSVNNVEQTNTNNISEQSAVVNTNIPNYNNSNIQHQNNKSKIIIGVLIGAIVLLILSFIILIAVNNRQKSNPSNNDIVNTTQKESDETEVNDDVVENDSKENINQTEEKETTSNISSLDWKSGEFQLDGNSFKLNSDYSTLVSKGWSVDFKKYGYSNGYVLNHKDKLLSTLDLENSKFSDSRVTIGIVNLDTAAKDATECQFWAISVNNSYTKTPVDFVLPGGIKSGSTIKEVEKVYGVPESKNIYRAESSGYTVYTYEYDYSIYLKLTIYDTDGLKGFDYKMY